MPAAIATDPADRPRWGGSGVFGILAFWYLSSRKMTTRAPPEVWQTILKYAISVSTFLDPDDVQRFPSSRSLRDEEFIWNDARPYWEAERQRNILQRVCRNWDAFLRVFAHRYIRMIDVQHEKVPEAALSKAIRISFDETDCNCDDYCSSDYPLYSWRRHRYEVADERCRRIFNQDSPIQMEIACVRDKYPDLEIFYNFAHKLINLKTLIVSTAPSKQFLGATVNHLRNLRHIYARGYWGSKETEGFNSTRLVSLSFVGQELTADDFEPQKWHLPSLQHLELSTNLHYTDELALLQNIGSGLLTLQWDPIGTQDLPSDIWDLCPKLLRIRTQRNLGSSPPPPHHPINSLYLYYSNDTSNRPPFTGSFPDWPMLQTIVLDIAWNSPWARKLGVSREWRSICRKRGIRIEDINGQSLKEYTTSNGIWFDKRGEVSDSEVSYVPGLR